ncbi:hypothetical protein LTR28_010467 [Elasticomyces elasticus]|nr:hypothetical protein LTR28_010467 [Elasticomyces elasticus]
MSDAATSRSSLPLAAARQIILQVGQQRFVTTCETLAAESSFFASLLSGRWDNALVDDSYFIDVDPSLFEHILRYLRRGVLPVFYDMHKGHDYALYLALLEEAKYFQIPRLQEWLENKRYLRALMVECSVEEVEGVGCLSTTRATDEYVEYYPGWGTKKVYVCPRGIFIHRGKPASGKNEAIVRLLAEREEVESFWQIGTMSMSEDK